MVASRHVGHRRSPTRLGVDTNADGQENTFDPSENVQVQARTAAEDAVASALSPQAAGGGGSARRFSASSWSTNASAGSVLSGRVSQRWGSQVSIRM